MRSFFSFFLRGVALFLAGAAVASAAAFKLPQAPTSFGPLDHVFLIVMENETDSDILGNPNAPFINDYAKTANRGSNYFAVGHPSAPNYLEIIGGSNFGLTSDFWPAWAIGGCVDNQPGGAFCSLAFAPIAAAGMDKAVVATVTKAGECNGLVAVSPSPTPNNCALYDYGAAPFTPMSIADQLVLKGMSWKSYQESLPTISARAAGVNYSDGVFSNLSDPSAFSPGPIPQLYAVKHNPFAYFLNIQTGANPALSFDRVRNFDGPEGLWADLQRAETTPNFSLIVPNQCNDMHGAAGASVICAAGTAAAKQLLIRQGDHALKKIIKAIKASPVWPVGRNVIVVVWDENSYGNAANRVILLTDTNYSKNGVVSAAPYDHYSLLRTIEAGFGLSCLNHACDRTTLVMNDLFGAN